MRGTSVGFYDRPIATDRGHAIDADPLVFEVCVFDEGDCSVVAVHGEVDACTAPALAECLTRAAQRSSRLVIDVGAVTFIDGSGLRVLLTAAGGSGRRSDPLVLRSPTLAIWRLLAITGLTSQITIEPDRRDGDLRPWRNRAHLR